MRGRTGMRDVWKDRVPRCQQGSRNQYFLMLLEMKGKLNVITLSPRDYFITHSSQKSTFPHLNDKNNFISLPWLSNQTPSLSV